MAMAKRTSTKRAGMATRAKAASKPAPKAARRVSKPRPARSAPTRVVLLVATRKGGFLLVSDAARRRFELSGPFFLGSVIQHMVLDPRDGRTLLMAASTGHLGPTVFRSTTWGKTWKEASAPPRFPKADGDSGRSVKSVFWLTPGHRSEPGVWYAGTSPEGLFRSEDSGNTWHGISGFNDHPMRAEWAKDGATPGGVLTHSISIDPRDAKHLYLGISVGGIFESWDGGEDWVPLNKGVDIDYRPEKDLEFGHDPHCLIIHPADPDRLYHQNHCGIYRLDRPGERWTRIGKAMPKKIRDIGFPIVAHPRDPKTVWVFPMDGTDVWPRTSPDGRPAAYMTRDGGKSWQRQDKGLPREQGWFTVKRQAMAADHGDPVGLYFGTTGGELWMSRNEGASWECIASHLPEILGVTSGARR